MFIRAAIVVLLFGFTLGALGQSNTLPKRLVLCLDGVSWRDVKALQEEAARDNRGRPISAFNLFRRLPIISEIFYEPPILYRNAKKSGASAIGGQSPAVEVPLK